MDLIIRWLNDEIGLQPQVRSFEKDFSNGYLFAKLLHLYNQNPRLNEFVDKSASNAKIKNFSLLEPLFRSLRIRFDSKIAFEIITCQANVALNLVRDLKMVLERMASRPTAVVGRERQTGQLPISNMPLRLGRPTYDRAQHELFVKSIKMYIRGQNAVDMAKHLKQFTDHRVRLEEEAQQGEVDDLREFFAQNDRIRQQRRLNLQREHEFLHDWQEKGIEEWAYNQQIKREREEHARRQVQRRLEIQERRQDAVVERSRNDVLRLIPEFQQTLLQTVPEVDLPPTVPTLPSSRAADALEPPILADGSLSEMYKINASATTSRQDFWKEARDKAGHPDQWKEEADVAMKRMKRDVERRKSARAQSERRRRKFLSDSQSDRDGRSEKREKIKLSKKLLKKPKNELELERALSTVQKHGAMFVENRRIREEEYEDRRQQDAEDAINRDNEYYYQMRSNYEVEIKEQALKYQNYTNSFQAAGHHRNIEMAQSMLAQLLGCVFILVDRRRMLEAPVEIQVERSVVKMFVGANSGNSGNSGNSNVAPVVAQTTFQHVVPSAQMEQELSELAYFRQRIGSGGEPPLKDSEERDASVTFDPSDVGLTLVSTLEEDEQILKAFQTGEGRDTLRDQLSSWLTDLTVESADDTVPGEEGEGGKDGDDQGRTNSGVTTDDVACAAYLCLAFTEAATKDSEEEEPQGVEGVTVVKVVRTMVERPDVYPSLLLDTPLLLEAVSKMSGEPEQEAPESDEEKSPAVEDNSGDGGGRNAVNVTTTVLSDSSVFLKAWFAACKEEDTPIPGLEAWAAGRTRGGEEGGQVAELDEYVRGTGLWSFAQEDRADVKGDEEGTATDTAADTTTDTTAEEEQKAASPAPTDIVPQHQLTGAIVRHLLDVVVGPPPPPVKPDVPRMEMTVVLVGKPFTGKTTQAKRLAERFNLAVVDVPSLLQEAIAFSEVDEGKTEIISLEGQALRLVDDRWYFKEVGVVGHAVRAALSEGSTVSDALVVRLITNRIRLVHAEAQAMRETALSDARALATPRSSTGQNNMSVEERAGMMLRTLFEAWDSDHSGEVDVGEMVTAVRAFGEGQSDESAREEALEVVQQMDADQDGKITWDEFQHFFKVLFDGIPERIFDEVIAKCLATTTAKPYKGWVLDGYPTTCAQAQLLETALTGYVHVAPDQRGQPSNDQERWSMLLAPQPPLPAVDPKALYGASGIDLVLDINITNQEVWRRALGRRYDPILKRTFHIETNPPSMDEPVKMRLVEPDDMANCRTSLAADLSLRDKDVVQLNAWYDLFNNRKIIKPFLPYGGAALGEDALFDVLVQPLSQMVQMQEDRLNAIAKGDQLEIKKRNVRALFPTVSSALLPPPLLDETVFEGEYTDINHPGCPRVIKISSLGSSEEGTATTVVVTGHDGDDTAMWECVGTVTASSASSVSQDEEAKDEAEAAEAAEATEATGAVGTAAETKATDTAVDSTDSTDTTTPTPPTLTIVLDLSSKGGPADLEGVWTGTGIRWVRDGEQTLVQEGAEQQDGWSKAAPKMDVEALRAVLGTISSTLATAAHAIREAFEEETQLNVVQELNLKNEMSPKQVLQLSDAFATNYAAYLATEMNAAMDDQTLLSSSTFVDIVLAICGTTIKGAFFSNVFNMMVAAAETTRNSLSYRLGRYYNTWAAGPGELDHVTISIGVESKRVWVQTYKARANDNFNAMTEQLKEEARAIRDAELAENEEEPDAGRKKIAKSGSKSKVSVEDLDEDEDLPPLVYPAMALVFDLGDLELPVEEEDGKGKKGKKGKGKGGKDDGGPAPAEPPEDIGAALPKQDFVLFALSLFDQFPDADADSIELSMDSFNAIIVELVEHARVNAGDPPEPEPPQPREVPTPPLPSVLTKLDVNNLELNHAHLAANLLNTWNDSVNDYVTTMNSVLIQLNTLCGKRASHYYEARQQMHEYIARESNQTGLVSALQKSINNLPQDMRYYDDVKAELHERISDALNLLHTNIEERESETKKDLNNMEKDGYVQFHVASVVQCYLSLMQCEMDRHHEVRGVLIDHMVGGQKTVFVPPRFVANANDGEEDNENIHGALPLLAPILNDAVFGANANGAGSAEAKDKKEGKKGSKGKKGKGKEDVEEETDETDPLLLLTNAMAVVESYLAQVREGEVLRKEKAKQALAEEREKALAEVADDDGKKGKKGKDAKGGTPEPTEDDEDANQSDDLQKALLYEENALLTKLKRIIRVCGRVTSDLNTYATTFFATLNQRAAQRYSEERSNLKSMHEYVTGVVEQEKAIDMFIGIQNTKNNTVVHRQDPILQDKPPLGPQIAPPTTSWSGPLGTEFFVNEMIGLVKPLDPPMKPAVETFSDVSFSPSQHEKMTLIFRNAMQQNGGTGGITATQALCIFQQLSTTGILPKKWATMSLEKVRKHICNKYIIDDQLQTIHWEKMLTTEFPISGADEHSAALKMQGILRKRSAIEEVEEKRRIKAAYNRFVELDADSSGFLDSDELQILAEWVWSSFHPGGKPVPVNKRNEMVNKLTKRVADANGLISFDAFEQWYRKTQNSLNKFNKFQKRNKELRSSGSSVVGDTGVSN